MQNRFLVLKVFFFFENAQYFSDKFQLLDTIWLFNKFKKPYFVTRNISKQIVQSRKHSTLSIVSRLFKNNERRHPKGASVLKNKNQRPHEKIESKNFISFSFKTSEISIPMDRLNSSLCTLICYSLQMQSICFAIEKVSKRGEI